ncbi:AMP-dependent synthetase and ligase family protein [Prunus dulcis]|uniref:4-coumarate--CoA ligase n=1 Tax=Prunus dulcis TaxID=3755 RepID=A0A4Y1RUA0_PRUDU|nr:AMP-dependent synthetase and ligase family protein [Prunus dulcis]
MSYSPASYNGLTLKPQLQLPYLRKTKHSEPESFSCRTVSFVVFTRNGIYQSKHLSIDLPSDPFLDVVSFIFSYQHDGVSSALIGSSCGSAISYSQLYSSVKSMASGLQQMGISQGDVILLLLPNSIYYPIAFLGVLYLGAIVTTMNPLSSVAEIKKQIADTKACHAFTGPENADKLQALGIPAILVDLAPRPVIKQQDTAAIMYSSGTTGVSKGVMLTHRNFIAAVAHFVRFEASQYEGSSLDNVYLAVLPLFHIYGLSLFVMGLLSLGSIVVVMKRFDVNEVIRAIDSCSTSIDSIDNKAKDGLAPHSLKSLKQVSCGAAQLSMKTIEDFVQAFPHIDLIQGYGMTETTAVGTRGFNTEKLRKPSSIGLLAPNMQAKVVDWDTGSPLPPTSTGELWLHGPGIMKGYLNNANATLSTIDEEGWLHTGDIVFFDEDGYLHLQDRLKDAIKYKGFQIAPADLEGVLINHPEILDVAVAGAMDEESGEVPVAFVVRKHISELNHDAVMDFVAAQVAPYKKVRKVVFVDSIPKSPAGKILRRELRSH